MNSMNQIHSRRNFLKLTAGAVAGVAASSNNSSSRLFQGSSAALSLPLGVCTSYEKADLLKSLGYSFIEENVGRFFNSRYRRR